VNRGLVFTLPGGLRVYHAGDTSVFGDMKIIADLYAPELALLEAQQLRLLQADREFGFRRKRWSRSTLMRR